MHCLLSTSLIWLFYWYKHHVLKFFLFTLIFNDWRLFMLFMQLNQFKAGTCYMKFHMLEWKGHLLHFSMISVRKHSVRCLQATFCSFTPNYCLQLPHRLVSPIYTHYILFIALWHRFIHALWHYSAWHIQTDTFPFMM